MKRSGLPAAIVAASILGAAAPAWAHHSHAMFNETQEVSITGTVKRFSFANPHVYLFVDVKSDDGKVTTWPVEMSYIQNMMSKGIVATTFKEGDTVTIKLNPLRDGHPGGSYTGATDANGHEYH